ncbi:MAG: hypothetical protein AAGB02_03050 [Pseudomonadota bacterium]
MNLPANDEKTFRKEQVLAEWLFAKAMLRQITCLEDFTPETALLVPSGDGAAKTVSFDDLGLTSRDAASIFRIGLKAHCEVIEHSKRQWLQVKCGLSDADLHQAFKLAESRRT